MRAQLLPAGPNPAASLLFVYIGLSDGPPFHFVSLLASHFCNSAHFKKLKKALEREYVLQVGVNGRFWG